MGANIEVGGWAGADAEITIFQWEGDGWVFKTEETIRTSLSQRGAKVFSVLIKCFGLFLVCSWCGFVGLLLACSSFVLGLFLACSGFLLCFLLIPCEGEDKLLLQKFRPL